VYVGTKDALVDDTVLVEVEDVEMEDSEEVIG